MNITEDMITPHHLLAAERWISENGMPLTDEGLARMGRDVTQEAHQVVEHMATKSLEALAAHKEDRKAGVETLEGMKGRELLQDIYRDLSQRAARSK